MAVSNVAVNTVALNNVALNTVVLNTVALNNVAFNTVALINVALKKYCLHLFDSASRGSSTMIDQRFPLHALFCGFAAISLASLPAFVQEVAAQDSVAQDPVAQKPAAQDAPASEPESKAVIDESAQKLGFFNARRMLGEAEAALESRNFDRAAEQFGAVAQGVKRPRMRMKALYGEAVAVLSSGSGQRSRAIDRLETLIDHYPRSERATDAALLLHLATVEPLSTVVVASTPEAGTEAENSETNVDAADDATKVRGLERQNTSLRRQLADARSELEKKEEAIEKLKQLVVGNGR